MTSDFQASLSLNTATAEQQLKEFSQRINTVVSSSLKTGSGSSSGSVASGVLSELQIIPSKLKVVGNSYAEYKNIADSSLKAITSYHKTAANEVKRMMEEEAKTNIRNAQLSKENRKYAEDWTKSYVADADKRADAIKREFEKTHPVLAGFKSNIQDVVHAMGKMALWTVAGTAIFGTIRFFQDASKAGYEYVAMLDDLGDVLGGSQNAMNETIVSMTMQGVSVDKAQRSLGKFVDTWDKATRGDKSSFELFKRWGVDIADAQGNLLGIEQVIKNVQRVARENPQEAGALSVSLFGARGTQLLDWLKQTEADTQKVKEALKQFGLELTDLDVESMREMQKNLALSQIAMTKLGIEMNKVIIPMFTNLFSLVKGIYEFTSVMGNDLSRISQQQFEVEVAPTLGREAIYNMIKNLQESGDLSAKEFAGSFEQRLFNEFKKKEQSQHFSPFFWLSEDVEKSTAKDKMVAYLTNMLNEMDKISSKRKLVTPDSLKTTKFSEQLNIIKPDYISSVKEYDVQLAKMEAELYALGDSYKFVYNAQSIYSKKLSEIDKQLSLAEGTVNKFKTNFSSLIKDTLSSGNVNVAIPLKFTGKESITEVINNIKTKFKDVEMNEGRKKQIDETIRQLEQLIADYDTAESSIVTLAKEKVDVLSKEIDVKLKNSIKIAVYDGISEGLQTGNFTSLINGLANTIGSSIAGAVSKAIMGTALISGITSAITAVASTASSILVSAVTNPVTAAIAATVYGLSSLIPNSASANQYAASLKASNVSAGTSTPADMQQIFKDISDKQEKAYHASRHKYGDVFGFTQYADTDETRRIAKEMSATQEIAKEMYSLYDIFTENMKKVNHQINMGNEAYDTNIEQLSAYEAEFATLNAEYEKAKAISPELAESLKEATWAEEERIAAIKKSVEEEKKAVASATNSFRRTFGGGSSDTDLIKQELASKNISFSSIPETMISNLDKAFKSGNISGQMYETFLTMYETAILEPYNATMEKMTFGMSTGSAEFDTLTEQLTYLQNVVSGLTMTEEDRKNLLTEIYGLEKQINEEYISSIENRYSQELNLHSKMYDTTVEKVEYYTNLISEAVSRGLDTEAIQSFREELELLTSPFQEYSDRVQSVEWTADLMPDTPQKLAYQLGELKNILNEFGDKLSEEDLHALKTKIFQLEVQQNVTITTGDIYQDADFDVIVRRIGELLRQQSSSWAAVSLSK